MISLHTFKNSVVGASEIDTPIEDQTWDGCFVERIRRSDRGSSIVVEACESMDFQRKVVILHDTRCIHSKILHLGLQKSSPLSRIRNWRMVSSREFEGQITDSWGASIRIDGFSKKSNDFVRYIIQFSAKVTISLHTFENSTFGASEMDTPIEDQKWSGRFVERIWGSDRESSIGVIDFL